MSDDPVRYWQDLTAHYRRMSDGELLELAARPEDLTEVAQQILRDEMKLRRLEKRAPAMAPTPEVNPSTHVDSVSGPFRDDYASPSESEDPEQSEPAHEYTWKTLLCDCESNDQAWQLFEALKRHGIESWVRQVSPYSTGFRGPQVYVAADQLEPAQAVAAQPIPQDILDAWNTVVPEFKVPICPRCGSADEVVLEAAEPSNAWLCESCGAEWTDEIEASDDDADGPKSPAG